MSGGLGVSRIEMGMSQMDLWMYNMALRLKSTSVKKGCTKSKKTQKFGVGAICKIDFVTPV